jgi:hypothetical protein
MTRVGDCRLITAAAVLLVCATSGARHVDAECDRPIPTIPVTGAFCGVAGNVLGEVMSGADIELLDSDGYIVASARTDSRGRFRFRPVPPGIYHYTTDGFTRSSDPIRVVKTGPQCTRRFQVTFAVLNECGGNSIPVDRGTLHLTGDADHVTSILVDGRGVDYTQRGHSLRADLDVGTHHVVVKAIFYEPVEFDVVIRRDRTTSRRLALTLSRF